MAGVLSAGAVNTLSPNSAVTVSGGTLDVSGYAQQIQSLNVGSLGTLNLGVGNLLSVSGSAGFASGSTLDIIGSNSITSLPYALMTYSGSPTGTFGNVVGLPSTDKLSYGSGTLDIVAAVNAPNYSLAATLAAHTIISGGSAGVTVTLTNAGGGQSPDNINFSGLSAATGANGTINGLASSGNNLAPSLSATNAGLSFSGNTPGVYTVSALAASVTGANGTLPTLSTSSTDSITVLDHAAPALSQASYGFGRVMLNSSLTAQSALQNQSASYRAALQVTSVPAGVSGVSLGDLISSGGSEGFSVAVNTTATGTQSTSYPIGVSDQQSLPGATGLTSQTFQVSGDVVDNRVVTSTSTDFGLVHVGAALSQSATLSTSGDDSQYTRVTVLSGGTDSNNLLTVSGGSNTLFNSAMATDVRTLSGTAGMAGAISGTVTLTTSGEGLTGELPINVLVPYTAQVTSGNAVWTSTSSSSWGAFPTGPTPAAWCMPRRARSPALPTPTRPPSTARTAYPRLTWTPT